MPPGLPYPKRVESAEDVRHNPGMATHSIRYYIEREPLNRQGYTRSGRYFGVGAPLYRYDSDAGGAWGHVRASGIKEAREKVRKLHPEARFTDAPAGTRANPSRKTGKARKTKTRAPKPGHRVKGGKIRFKSGRTLADAADPVALNHPHCAKFCVLGGASCSVERRPNSDLDEAIAASADIV